MEQVWKEWAHFWLGPLPASLSGLSPVVITREGEMVKEKVLQSSTYPQTTCQDEDTSLHAHIQCLAKLRGKC